MDSFKIHKAVIDDYRSYIDSFIQIRDDKIRNVVTEALREGRLWPEPLIQFNPSFEMVGDIDAITTKYKLHGELRHIFQGLRLYRHQVESISLGVSGKDFVVTSGTGSGKSLTYIATIFQHLLSTPPATGEISAVIVYPMNALINSQFEEFEKYRRTYEESTGRTFPITYAQYTGQEDEEKRKRIQESPPSILLTNYMMLELILTRLRERTLRDSIYSGLRFLIFDELHTYRGRQGADVALLIRRIRSQSAHAVLCVGTSATMISGGTPTEQKSEIAEVASLLFGKQFVASQIVGESLTRSFDWDGHPPSQSELILATDAPVDEDAPLENLKRHPTAIWLENVVALEDRDGTLLRRRPSSLSEIVRRLSEVSGKTEQQARAHLEAVLRWITWTNVSRKSERYTWLPFKLHQFISQTGSVYTTLDQDEQRHISLEPGVYLLDQEEKKPIFPNVFSRISGHAFICVTKNPESGCLEPREFRSSTTEEGDLLDGYVLVGDDIWDPQLDIENLPDSWLSRRRNGTVEPAKAYRDWLPSRIHFDEFGRYSESETLKCHGWFMPAPLLFDPTAGIFFDTKTNEGTKLTSLGYEGRSTSTTIASFSILSKLEEDGIERKDQKLLSFTDNRQDAALQAGHFNDFLHIVQLRAGVHRAISQSQIKQLDYTSLGRAIREALALPFLEYANTSAEPAFPNVRRRYEEALEKYLVYQALYDLRRGWRVVLPNLEQCALVQLRYRDLEEVASTSQAWASVPLFDHLEPSQRAEVIANVLDHFRHEFALFSETYLQADKRKGSEKEIRELLKSPWGLDNDEELPDPFHLRYESLAPFAGVFTKSIGPASSMGKYIRSTARSVDPTLEFKGENYRGFVSALLGKLEEAGFLRSKEARNANNQPTRIYQLKLDCLIWEAGDGKTVRPDAVRLRTYKDVALRPNYFFRALYQRDFSSAKRLRGDEHTGMLKAEQRIEREEQFRDGRISALFCSPTMELGIDISNLNVVHMRNAPPNPSNYAQRSGRAGRTGQAALVFTYCSSYSNHDRHYFRNQGALVAGSVVPPRLDLTNKELLTTHLHALFLSEVGLKELDTTIMDLVTEDSGLSLSAQVKARLNTSQETARRIKSSFKKAIIDFEGSLRSEKSGWYSDDWVDRQLSNLTESLNTALDRWRDLYRSAKSLLTTSTQQIESGRLGLGSPEYKMARRNMDQATRQLDLLRNTSKGKGRDLSEFYPYRYLASEGFLPGYNFTRLPVRTFLQTDDTGGEFISRPRRLALREFGPGNIIYYNGKKYEVRQILLHDPENSLKEAKISLQSGYYLSDDQKGLEICPFSGANLADNANREVLVDLLEMSETRAQRRDRISCEEEERVSRGFQIETYFSIDDADFDRVRRAIVRTDQEPLLNLQFIPAARLVDINRKWRSRPQEGFPLGLVTGEWKREKDLESDVAREPIRRVKLFTSDTADALYIEPVKALGLTLAGVITLQYALKRAIENVFQIESNEIGVVSLGLPDRPNILLYEAAEGTLGVLSQFVDDAETFARVVNEAIRLCRYNDETYKGPASYDDLLSYYNQRDHKIIDRHLIKGGLERLLACRLELVTNRQYRDYEQHYQALLRTIDPSSSTERKFLDYLHEHSLRLPDAAQKQIEGLYVQPDFFYESDFWVFCDGTPHDDPQVKAEDQSKRQAILNRGNQVFVYYYKEDLAQRIASRPDIFKKVK